MLDDTIRELLASLSLDEKISLLGGADGWQTQDIERLGIGSIKTTDGPAGARGSLSVDGPKAALLPAPVVQSATWSKSNVRKLGRLLSRETRSKAAQILLAPTVCCLRNPLGGRNFESFSEDPLLSGQLAIEYVTGLQEDGMVVATAKHFVANEQEHDRFATNAEIDEKALREIYLRPFEMLVKSASPPGCFMTAYNCVNGVHMDMNEYLVNQVLRKQWGFKGLVMSDWGGTNSTVESLMAGCDLEMPGPPLRRGGKIRAALPSKSLEASIDESCGRLLSLAQRLNLLGLSKDEVAATRNRAEETWTSPEDLQTLRQIAADGMVLLKNDLDVLPLKLDVFGGKKISFIGPNAAIGAANGGGSAAMNPQYLTHPLESFKRKLTELDANVDLHFAAGCPAYKWTPLLSPTQWEGSEAMLRIDFFASTDCSGGIFETQHRNSSSIDLFDSGPAALRDGGKPYSLRLTSTLTPASTGEHIFSVSSVGGARLFIDGKLLIDNSEWTAAGETFYSFGSVECRETIHLKKGQRYSVVLVAWSRIKETDVESDPAAIEPMHVYGAQPSSRLGYCEESSDTIEGAVALAKESDLTVIVVGLNEEWESEGYDRQTMNLPGEQDRLVQDILSTVSHPERIIVVNQSGSAVEMPWIDSAHTVLQAWYGGQEAGNALADVLLGIQSPAGRLPFTWPRTYSDLPFAIDKESWPGVDGKVIYKESSKIGYRWYLGAAVQPLWWFGFGLGYTSFEVRNLRVHQQSDRWTASLTVTNTGPRAGQDVVQVYVWPKDQPSAKGLMAFSKTEEVEPGAVSTLELDLQFRDMANWIDGEWRLRSGMYEVGIGKHAGDKNMLVQQVEIRRDMHWDP
ncbi:hypothetical protein AAFC00_004405 [Neodothiora populina]|uniref:beta-glucosidase n=1 Tax=Neodothiora populina TaxID=2781224 RepID=A0ABR3PPI1_9PEZI